MNEVLQKFPDTPLRDMVLFWLSRSYYKNGNLRDAARVMSQFSKEYPDNPLKGTVDEELLALTARYDKGEQLPISSPPAPDADVQLAARKVDAEKARLAREKAEQEQRAKEQSEHERIAVAKSEEQRRSQEKAALAARAIEEAEQQKLASIKAEEERKASEKLKAEQAKLEQAEHEKLVSQQDEMVRMALAKTEQKLLAAEKSAEAQENAEKKVLAEQYRTIVAKAEADRLAAEAVEKRSAVLKAEADRAAAEKIAQKAELLRVERERAEKERAAIAAAEATRLAAAQKELERKAASTVEAERLALEKSASAKRAAEAEQQKMALVKQAQERTAAEMAEKERLAALAAEASQRSAVKPEQSPRQPAQSAQVADAAKPAPAKIDGQQVPQQRDSDEKARAAKSALREKAIAQYKSILVTYPNTKAASAAAVKLKELGVAVAMPAQAAAPEPQAENAQVLRLEVAQFAGLEFNLPAQPQTYNAAQRISIPFEITNQGNGSDSFYLESGFPAEFSAEFTSVAMPAQSLNQTGILAPGESFKGLVHLTIPAASIDGLRISHPIKAASRTMTEASQSREVRVVAAAPLLRATVKADRNNPLPGEKITYRIAVLNVGSTAAQDVSFRLNFPPQLEPVEYAASGFRQEMKAALVIDGLQIKSGENREFSLAFQLKDGSLAGQEILTRAELHNNLLKTFSAFVSTAAYVQPQHGLLVQPGSERLVVIPGQTVSIPFIVTNSGNVREKFTVVSSGKGAQVTNIFHDLNRDGVRQANEPFITEIGPLAAKEEASIVMEIQTPRNAVDGSDDSSQISFRSEGDASRFFSGVTRLVYSRPVLHMAMSGRDGKLKPGEVGSFDLTLTNRGTNLARIVELQSAWPEQLELVAADPATNSVSNGTVFWKFKELGAAEKRIIKVSFRVKPGTGMGTNIQVKNTLTYEDQIGNRY